MFYLPVTKEGLPKRKKITNSEKLLITKEIYGSQNKRGNFFASGGVFIDFGSKTKMQNIKKQETLPYCSTSHIFLSPVYKLDSIKNGPERYNQNPFSISMLRIINQI